MPTQSQLNFLIERAKKETDSTSLQLAAAQKALTNADSKLTVLLKYKEDYQHQLGTTISNGTFGEQLRNFQEFIGNIARAVDQQRSEVDRKRVALKKAESNWRDAQRVLQSYQALTNRMAKQAKIVEEKKLQKENDEFATKSFLRTARGN